MILHGTVSKFSNQILVSREKLRTKKKKRVMEANTSYKRNETAFLLKFCQPQVIFHTFTPNASKVRECIGLTKQGLIEVCISDTVKQD